MYIKYIEELYLTRTHIIVSNHIINSYFFFSKFIFLLLVVLIMNFLGYSRPLDLRKIQWCRFFSFLDLT